MLLLAQGAAEAATLNDLTYAQIVSNVPLDRQVEAVRAVGVRKVRLAVRWYEVERQRGRLDWSATDFRVNSVKRAGLTPLIVVFGGNAAFSGVPGTKGITPSSAASMAGHAFFAAEAVRRYGIGTAAAPIVYELWNEPNTRTFWGRPPEPETYAELAEGACRAMKRVAPSVKVLAFGMEGTPVKSPYVVPAYGLDIYQEWARRAATAGLMDCVDGISMHPYLSPPELHFSLEPKLQRFMTDHWRKPAPAMIAHTEWGYAIDLKHGRAAQDQAALDLRALMVGTGLGRITNIYQSVDTGSDPAKPDESYGLVTYTGTVKPAGKAIRRLLDAIGDYTIAPLEVIADNPKGYRFSASRGSARAQVLWTSSGTGSIAVPLGAKAIDLVSGEARPSNGGRVELTPTPVLVTWGS